MQLLLFFFLVTSIHKGYMLIICFHFITKDLNQELRSIEEKSFFLPYTLNSVKM